MSKPPLVSIGEDGLQGWDDFDRWAHDNLVRWHRVDRESKLRDMDEIDRLRLMTYLYAVELERLREGETMLESPEVHERGSASFFLDGLIRIAGEAHKKTNSRGPR